MLDTGQKKTILSRIVNNRSSGFGMSRSIIIRTLQESELESWFDHCAQVFRQKTEREHFVRHW